MFVLAPVLTLQLSILRFASTYNIKTPSALIVDDTTEVSPWAQEALFARWRYSSKQLVCQPIKIDLTPR